MNKISIALCTYNGAKFLREQIESYVQQTRLPDELVVCDDGSTDGTIDMLREFADAAPFPVRVYVNEKNLGSTKNFEKAIGLCLGEIIFLSDQDDVWAPGKIEKMVAVLDNDKSTGLVFSDANIVNKTLQHTGRTLWSYTFPKKKRAVAKKGMFFEVLVSQNVVTGATMAFRAGYKEIFLPIPNDIPNLIHDNWISLIIAASARVVFLDEPLVDYRQHGSQQLGINFTELDTKGLKARQGEYIRAIEFVRRDIPRLERLSTIFEQDSRFGDRGGAIDVPQLIAEKVELIQHLEARRALPSGRYQRVLPVIRELLSGRYTRFSKGALSAAKDILESE